ncbi:MAG TPA: long-chain fatty acid--CoA ligase [Candidatus Dormibacteraeota bacterium]|nr:long-chain fatty acid--CoA ligase [Candidatus Dormibacteraeota bacterium]
MSMMQASLNSWMMFDHAERYFPDTEIVTQIGPGERHRYTYRDFSHRTQQLMHALDALGLEDQAHLATMAWNGYRHLECYFAIPCTGRVLHTLNPRLPTQDLEFIITDADDQVIFVDENLLPVLERVRDSLSGVRHIVVFAERVPTTALENVVSYEDLILGHPAKYPRREIAEETTLGICYTSGTTGRPKGVEYTHRSTYLHALTTTSGAATGMGPQDAGLAVVPMFHVNAWGAPFAATMVGAKQVFTGPFMDPATIVSLMVDERVTVALGVPTIWAGVAEEMTRQQVKMPHLRFVMAGGSQPPMALIERYEKEFGITLVQGWGMTETSPVAALAWPKEKMRDWDPDRLRAEVRIKAGLPLPGVDVKIVGDDGEELPADGNSIGELLVKGPWVIDSYRGGATPERFTDDGWFRTGDVASMSPEGYFVIVDRTKDLIKSGGEWISSVDMEGDIMAMPGVLEAAVIAIPDEKWQERPLAAVVPRPGAELTLDKIRQHLADKGWAKWQLPDRLELVEVVPKTGVGKFDKKVLRARYGAASPPQL